MEEIEIVRRKIDLIKAQHYQLDPEAAVGTLDPLIAFLGYKKLERSPPDGHRPFSFTVIGEYVLVRLFSQDLSKGGDVWTDVELTVTPDETVPYGGCSTGFDEHPCRKDPSPSTEPPHTGGVSGEDVPAPIPTVGSDEPWEPLDDTGDDPVRKITAPVVDGKIYIELHKTYEFKDGVLVHRESRYGFEVTPEEVVLSRRERRPFRAKRNNSYFDIIDTVTGGGHTRGVESIENLIVLVETRLGRAKAD